MARNIIFRHSQSQIYHVLHCCTNQRTSLDWIIIVIIRLLNWRAEQIFELIFFLFIDSATSKKATPVVEFCIILIFYKVLRINVRETRSFHCGKVGFLARFAAWKAHDILRIYIVKHLLFGFQIGIFTLRSYWHWKVGNGLLMVGRLNQVELNMAADPFAAVLDLFAFLLFFEQSFHIILNFPWW